MPPLAPPAPLVVPIETELDDFEALYRDLTLLNLPLPNSKKLLEKRQAENEKVNREKFKAGSVTSTTAPKPPAPPVPSVPKPKV